MQGRPRVLLLAEAANPEWVSVPLVGWSHARALSRVADVHLVTQIRNQPAILRAGLASESFTSIDSEKLAAPLYGLAERLRGGSGKGWTTVSALMTLSYPYFEHLVWRRFREPLLRKEFDLVHRLTPLSPTVPSLLASRLASIGIPFVLGPLNGGTPWPPGYGRIRRAEREWLSYVRGAFKLLPGYRSTRRHAAAILVGSRSTHAEIPAAYRHKCIYIPENGIDEDRFPAANKEAASDGKLRIAFVGRLVPYKGADVVIEAAAPLLREGAAVLDIIGDGPQMSQLQDMVARQQLQSSVRLEGWLEHSRLQQQLARADVFAFPSVREFGGGAVLEAMACGVVPLVADHGGPAELISPDSGVLLAMGDRNALRERLSAALRELAGDRLRLRDLGRGARERVSRYFTWEKKAAQVMEVYRWVLGWRSARPDFGMPFP